MLYLAFSFETNDKNTALINQTQLVKQSSDISCENQTYNIYKLC
jgi:hypothetical protein